MGRSSPDLTAPRFPHVDRGRGHYESFYVTATDPDGGRAIWARHTVLKAPGAEPEATLWLTAFGPEPSAHRETLGAVPVTAGSGWMEAGETRVAPGAARGAADGARWELTWTASTSEPLPYLPALRLYDAPLPRTKGAALVPRGSADGVVESAAGRWELHGWDVIVGHNWGAEHAEHWIWLHAALPDGGWFDLALARARVGPLLLPWLGGGGLHLGGRFVRLGGPRGRPRVTITPQDVHVEVPAGGEHLRLRASLAAERTVRWDYASPSGAARHVRNCSVADLDLRLGDRQVSVAGVAAAEVGGPDPA